MPALLVPSLFAPACGGGSGPDASPACPTCVAPDPSICEAALDVATSDEAAEEIARSPKAAGSRFRPPSGEKLRPSRELRATADIEIAIDDVERRAPFCTESGGNRCNGPWFTYEMPFASATSGVATWPDGVECLEPGPTSSLCSKIRVAEGYRVRFQRFRVISQFLGQLDHAVRVVSACAQPCAPGEAWCAASATCIAADAMCSLCEGHSSRICACRTGWGPRSDGTACMYDQSEDATVEGTCRQGVCE